MFPTETVYGLGANALCDSAVAQVYALKGRPSFNPLIVHVKDQEQAQKYGIFSETACLLAKKFWPGPLTLVVPLNPHSGVSKLALAGLDTVALRVPAHPMAQALLSLLDFPLVAPSANKSGHLSPTTSQHAKDSLAHKSPFLLEGGPCEKGIESTIVSVLGSGCTLLRPGALTLEDLESCLGAPLSFSQDKKILSPGQTDSHYAPHLPLRINALSPQAGECYIGFGPAPKAHFNLSEKGDLMEAAANLFACLHQADQGSLYEGIAIAPIPASGVGIALNDRLRRASFARETAL